MNHHTLSAFVILFASVSSGVAADSSGQKTDATLPAIFNDKDLTGWKTPAPNPFWRVENGVLVGENDAALTGSMLWTEKSYGNFVLELEARWEGIVDTGVMLRSPELQLQMGISGSLKRDMTGSFYVIGGGYPENGQAREAEKYLKAGDWNKFRLEARGTTFHVWINGQKLVEYSEPKFSGAAPVGLQVHPGREMKVEFRNIRLAELP